MRHKATDALIIVIAVLLLAASAAFAAYQT